MAYRSRKPKIQFLRKWKYLFRTIKAWVSGFWKARIFLCTQFSIPLTWTSASGHHQPVTLQSCNGELLCAGWHLHALLAVNIFFGRRWADLVSILSPLLIGYVVSLTFEIHTSLQLFMSFKNIFRRVLKLLQVSKRVLSNHKGTYFKTIWKY